MTVHIARDLRVSLSWLSEALSEGHEAAYVAMETTAKLFKEMNSELILNDEGAMRRKRAAAEENLAVLRKETHLIASAMRMIQAPAPAALMREADEALAEITADSHVEKDIHERLSAISSGIVTSRIYCTLLQSGSVDAPIVVLDSINAIRRVRGKPLIGVGEIVTATVPLRFDDVPGKLKSVNKEKAQQAIGKLLAAYREAVSKFVEDGDETMAPRLLEVLGVLTTMMRSNAVGNYFWIVSAAVEVAAAKERNLDATFAQIMFATDDVIATVEVGGEWQAEEGLSPAKYMTAFYFLAMVGMDTPKAKEVSDRFALHESLPTAEEVERFRQSMAGGEMALSGTVLPQVLQSIEQLMLALDKAFKEEGVRASRQMHNALHHFPSLASTLRLCGFTQWGDRVADQGAFLDEYKDYPHKLTAGDKERVVEQIIYVETQAKLYLAGISGDDPEAARKLFDHDIVKTLVRETLIELEKIKQRISVYVASGTEREELVNGVEELRQVSQALTLYDIGDVHPILNALVYVVKALTDGGAGIDEASMAAIAEVVTGVEEHLTCVEQRVSPHPVFLETARQGLLVLGVADPSAVHQVTIAPKASAPANGVSGDLDLNAINSFKEDVEASVVAAEDAIGEVSIDSREALTEVRDALSEIEGNARILRQDVLGDLAATLQDATVEMAAAAEETVEPLKAVIVEGLRAIRGILPNPMAHKAELALKECLGKAQTDIESIVNAEQPAQPSNAKPLTTASGMDAKLLEIYKKEFARYSAPVASYLEAAKENADAAAVTDEVMLWLHSLAGSSRSAGFHDVGHVFKSAELCWGAFRGNGVVPTEAALTVLADVLEETTKAVDRFDEVTTLNRKDELIATLETLYTQGLAGAVAGEDEPKKRKRRRRRRKKGVEAPEPEVFELGMQSADGEEDADIEVERDVAPAGASAPETQKESHAAVKPSEPVGKPEVSLCQAVDPAQVDETVLEIFLEEAEEVTAAANELLVAWLDNPLDASKAQPARVAFHTLKGSSRMAINPNPVSDLAWEYERLLNLVMDRKVEVSSELIEACQAAIALMPKVVETLKGAAVPVNDIRDLINRARAFAGLPLVTAGERSTEEVVALAPAEQPKVVDLSISVPIMMDVIDETAEVAAPPALPDRECAGAEIVLYDPDTLPLFLDECDVTIPRIEAYLDAWEESPGAAKDIATLKRHMHTLKGSARLAGVEVIGTLTHEAESVLDAVDKGVIQQSPALYALMREVFDAVTTMVDAARAGQSVGPVPALASALEHAVDFHEILLPDNVTTPATEVAPAVAVVEETTADACEAVAAVQTQKAEPNAQGEESAPVAAAAEYDPDTLPLFLDECDVTIPRIESYLEAWSATPEDAKDIATLKRHMHTLKGSARLARIEVIGTLTHEAESVLEAVDKGVIKQSPALYTLMREVFDAVTTMVDAARDGQPAEPVPALAAALEHAVDFHEIVLHGGSAPSAVSAGVQTPEPAPQQAGRALGDVACDIEDILDLWATNPEDERQLRPVAALLREASGASSLVAGLCVDAAELLLTVAEGEIAYDTDVFTLVVLLVDEMNRCAKAQRKGDGYEPKAGLVSAVARARASGVVDLEAATGKPKAVAKVEASQEVPAEAVEVGEVSADLKVSFVNEATGIIESLADLVDNWLDTVADESAVARLKRHMHTLKGLGRMVGLGGLANLTHEMETAYDRLAIGKLGAKDIEGVMVSAHDALTDALRAYIEEDVVIDLGPQVAAVRTMKPIGKQPATSLKVVAQPAKEPPRQAAQKAVPPAPARPIIVHNADSVRGQIEAAMAARSVAMDGTAKAGDLDSMRIQLGLLNKVIRQASEITAHRFKLSSQYNLLEAHERDIADSADKAMSIVEQLEPLLQQYSDRMMREANIDPLELDRFSEIRTLTVVLAEVLSNIKGSVTALDENSHHLASLIADQSLMSRDIYADIITARLVPFSGISSRLKKVVRQTAGELGKNISIDIRGEGIPLDKTLVDNLAAPMEHILRNSCDHGIEKPEQRAAAGKDPAGKVVITVMKSAAEAIIEVTDDGGGIKTGVIRKKALEKGLMSATDNLSDKEVMQFIMHAGFSTADKVSQISGRGVGMDVVKTTIQDLGGTIDIESEVGKGTTFRIRVPVALGASRVVFVRTGQTVFAIPSNIVERVEHYTRDMFETDPKCIMHDETEYKRIHLASLTGMVDNKQAYRAPLTPIVFCRAAGYALAIEVDEAIGMPEVAIKPLPPMLQNIQGVFGATEKVDGTPVLLLDIATMVRHNLVPKGQTFEVRKNRTMLTRQAQRPLAMVVDDSVAMRKTISGTLNAMGFDTMTAMDGLQALEMLKDNRVPEVIVVDVEMPRMDGYELTRAIRRNEKVKHVPIIMVTSRSGEEHQEHARSVGVSRFMVKPLRPAEFQAAVRELVKGAWSAAQGAVTPA